MPRAAGRERVSAAQRGLVGPAAPVSVAQFDFDPTHPTLAHKHYDRSKDEESYRAFLVRAPSPRPAAGQRCKVANRNVGDFGWEGSLTRPFREARRFPSTRL
jgi:hypothetical protein